jgi:hypothetical protein
MSWAVLYARDESYYYISAKPEELEFTPYTATEFRNAAPFKTLSVDSFYQSISVLFGLDQKTVVFYTPDLAGVVEPVLQTKWGDLFYQETFFDSEGVPVLAAAMNTPFVFVRDQSLLAILKDSYLHSSLLILMTILIGLIGLTAFLPMAWSRSVPIQFKRLVDWFNGSERPIDLDAKKDHIDSIEEFLEPPAERVRSEPPEWAEQVFQPAPINTSMRVHAELKQVRQDDGNDLYLKVHIPRINAPGLHLPEKTELSLPAFRIPNPLFIALAVLFAIAAQIMIQIGNSWAGIAFYSLSAAGMGTWIRLNPKWKNVFSNQWQISPRVEKFLLGALMAGTAFIRYYDLKFRVYGVDGDEVKWTIQSWYSTILMVHKGDFISHYDFMPVSFWIRSVFLRLFGLNFISARIESATLSLISVFFLYLLVRRLSASRPLALLTALLYSVSFFALNFAHQAMGETTPEVWNIASFYILIIAVQERKLWQFQLTGILLALGMLTFEMFLPTPLIVMLYLAGVGLFEIFTKRTSARKWFQYLLMVAWPVMLAYFVYTQEILNVRRGYDLGIVMQFSGNGSNFLGIFLFLFRNVGHLFQTIFYHITWTDSIVYWDGSLINAFLLPFVVIGFVYNIWNIRRRYYALIPLWFLIHIAVGPLSLGAVYPRVLFMVLPPLMIWGAMGLWTFLGALRAIFDNRRIKLALPVFLLVLIAIIFNDYHIFTTSLYDAVDKQKRRELSELTIQSAGDVPMILYPFLPNQDDTLALESSVILLSVAGETHLGEDSAGRFQQLEFGKVLTTLWEDRQLSGVDLFFDKTTFLQDQRDQALNIVLKCYPGVTIKESGRFFTVYHFASAVLALPQCYQGISPVSIAPQNGVTIPSGGPIIFSWDTKGVKSTSHSLILQRKVAGTYWIEVEDAFTGPFWVYSSGFVNDFSGGGFLMDGWQSGDAQYTFSVPSNGQYRIWIRSYKRRINDQHNFITIDGKEMGFAGDNNALNEWVWEDLGSFNLSQGPLPITLSRTYGKDEEFSVFIDVLLITSDLVNLPAQVRVWDNVATTTEVQSSTSEYTLSEILPPGDYRWKIRIYDGNYLIDSDGLRGLETPMSTFTLTP